jgi:hypothetical protein
LRVEGRPSLGSEADIERGRDCVELRLAHDVLARASGVEMEEERSGWSTSSTVGKKGGVGVPCGYLDGVFLPILRIRYHYLPEGALRTPHSTHASLAQWLR